VVERRAGDDRSYSAFAVTFFLTRSVGAAIARAEPAWIEAAVQGAHPVYRGGAVRRGCRVLANHRTHIKIFS